MSNARNNNPLTISSSILVAASCLCMGLYPGVAHANTTQDITTEPKALTPGIKNPEVQVIQVQLKALGYYNGSIDGNYNTSTRESVTKFQKALKLERIDGVADKATRKTLKMVLEGKTTIPATTTTTNNTQIPAQPVDQATPTNNNNQDILWWTLLSLSSIGAIGFIVYILYKEKNNKSTPSESKTTSEPTATQQKLLTPLSLEAPSVAPEFLPSSEMSIMPKVNVADDLMENLKSLDAAKQKKAIWNLSQKGDSRAIEPLVQLLGSADSQQHSLILSALADISIRNLKPIRKALAMSVQSENSEVRQNAIRDLARIHDMMAQINQALYHSLSDGDPEVQATAKYALRQMNGNSVDYPESPEEDKMDVLTRY